MADLALVDGDLAKTDTTKPKILPGVHESGDIDWPFTFPLKKPIRAFDDEHSKITLAEPTAGQAVKHGLLMRGISEENAADLISDLSEIPAASVLKMTASDFMALTAILARFFRAAAV